MPDTNAVCFQGIARVYRNAVVSHIRCTLIEKYPDEWEDKITTTFTEAEWYEAKENAERSYKTGALSTQPTDAADLLGVNHLYNVFDRYFDDLFPNKQQSSESDRKRMKQDILSWARMIKNYRDPVIGHPIETDVAREDAEAMLDWARRVLSHFDSDAAQQIKELRNSLNDTAEPPQVLEASVLPARESIALQFTGRETELKELKKWIQDPHSHIWLLAGDGGKGKTAIAYEFAVDVMQEPPTGIEIVIWLSVKVRRFQSGTSVSIDNPDFSDLDSALNRVLSAYGTPNIADMDIRMKEEQCRDYLTELPALIVLDDVDSLEGQDIDAMNFFIHRTQVTSSKVLLTSRRIPFEMEPMVTQIKGFEPGSEEGFEFVDSRIKMYRMDASQFSKALLDDIIKACDGSPLFIQDFLRLCRVGESPRSAIKLWKEREGSEARKYALGREFEMLSNPAKAVLLTCALSASPVSLTEIQVCARLSEDVSRAAIEELSRLFLVPASSFIEGVHRFQLEVNTRQLVLDIQGNTDLAQRIRNSMDARNEVQGTRSQRETIGQYIRQAVSLVKLDKHADAESTLLRASDVFMEHPDLYGTIGWVYKSWKPQPRYIDARDYFRRAATLKSSKEDTYRHWCELEETQSEWTSAAKAAEAGLEILKSSRRLAFLAGRARSRLANDLFWQAQHGRAGQEAKRAGMHLANALAEIDQIQDNEYFLHGQILRAVTINYTLLARIAQFEQDTRDEKRFIGLLGSSLLRWSSEHPSDPNLPSERSRCLRMFPQLAQQIS